MDCYSYWMYIFIYSFHSIFYFSFSPCKIVLQAAGWWTNDGLHITEVSMKLCQLSICSKPLCLWSRVLTIYQFMSCVPHSLWSQALAIFHLPFFPSSACDENLTSVAQRYDLMFIRLWGTGHACNFWEQPICQHAFKLQVHKQMMINTLLSPPTSSDTFVCAASFFAYDLLL